MSGRTLNIICLVVATILATVGVFTQDVIRLLSAIIILQMIGLNR